MPIDLDPTKLGPNFSEAAFELAKGVVPDNEGIVTTEGPNGETFCVSSYQNVFGYLSYDGRSYDGQCSFFQMGEHRYDADGVVEAVPTALPEGLGWFIIIGVGLIFAVITSAMVWLNARRYPSEDANNSSEHFSTAGRTIPAGITAADVVSKWTWAATLLQSSNVAYKYGVSGPFWYASGATIQVLLFSILAVEIKRKCPSIHTVLEVVLVRWGTAAHAVFLFFCLMTNMIVTGMLILGGAAAVEALTGVDTVASCFLIPLGVCTYTAFGGLKGTYYASWTHTFIIYIALLTFLWKVYAGPSDLGSVEKVWDNLKVISIKYPVVGNKDGAYHTMFSEGGMIFGIINIVGNFGTVFVDQSYWQGAIACKPAATWKGYLLGGMAWFAIPFSLATTMGLAARALDLPITMNEAGAGLVPPAVATHLMGKGGAFLVTLQLFLAVTSTANSEQLAVSSLFAYDIYKIYINPKATGKQIIFVSRAGVVVWAILSAIFGVILFELGISLGWVYGAMGNFIGSAVAPICFSLTYKNCTGLGAILGAVLGLIAGMVGWCSMATYESDDLVFKDKLGQNYPLLVGNLLALVISPLVAVVVSTLQGGQNYDWDQLDAETGKYVVADEDDDAAHQHHGDDEDSIETMNAIYMKIVVMAILLSFVLIFLWPIFTLPAQVFSLQYFGFWVAIAFIWGHVAAFITIIYPIWEVRQDLMDMFSGKPPAIVPPPVRSIEDPVAPSAKMVEMLPVQEAPLKAQPQEPTAQGQAVFPTQQQQPQAPMGFYQPQMPMQGMGGYGMQPGMGGMQGMQGMGYPSAYGQAPPMFYGQ